MATYAISDIHGAYEEFMRLLRKINFHYDGSDTLYLLGDYGDWGLMSMETILKVKEMDEQYPFVHCVMGNHEEMFLDTLHSGYRGGSDPGPQALNWLYGNRGRGTFEAFLSMDRAAQDDLTGWLESLRLSFDAEAGGVHYMLAHAYPYYYDVQYSKREALRHRTDALWRRLLIRENPFGAYRGDRHYDMLICGHTISDYYYQQLRLERNWPYRKPAQSVRNRIFRGEMFTDIDCGAKCMDFVPEENEIIHTAALRAQLAALRLDDGESFYVHRPAAQSACIELPSVSVPDLHLREYLQDFHIPAVHFQEMAAPVLRQAQEAAKKIMGED